MAVSAAAKVAYEAVTILTDKKKRETLLMIIAIPFVLIIVILSSLFYRADTQDDLYLLAAEEIRIDKNAVNSLDGDLIRCIYLLLNSEVSEDIETIKEFIAAYFYIEEVQEIVIDGEVYTVVTNRFLSFEEILMMVKEPPFSFDDATVEILQFFKPHPELTVDDNFVAPCSGRITSDYGERINPITGKGDISMHPAIDIQGAWHQPIFSIADGEVVKVSTIKSGYGNHIIIKHFVNNQSFYSFYAHLSSIAVSVGQTVTMGETIGKEGGAKSDPNPGTSTGHHLHFEIRRTMSGDQVNPTNIFKRKLFL